jgi:hypothetical protein
MNLIQKLSNSSLTKSSTFVSFVSILAVIGPVVVVSAGFWDAISHLQKEPEFFWSPSHIIVYTGVSLTSCGAILGIVLILQKSVHGSLKTGIKLIIAVSVLQIIS